MILHYIMILHYHTFTDPLIPYYSAGSGDEKRKAVAPYLGKITIVITSAPVL
jgi:hypothetical protein